MTSPTQVISLYRSILREAHKFTNYNIRDWTKRKAGFEFRKHAGEADGSAVTAAYKKGLQDFELVKRQTAIYAMFAGPHRHIMDLKLTP